MLLPQATIWKVQSWRWLPWQTQNSATVSVPLTGSCPAQTQLMNEPAYLSTGRDTSKVVAQPCTGTASVALRVTSLDTVGSYTGSVVLTTESGGTVKLTVRHSDAWLWPAVVVTLGVLTSLAIRRWSVRSTLRECLRDLTQASDALEAVRQELSTAAAGSAYRITASVQHRLGALRHEVIWVAAAHPLCLAETAPDYMGVKQKIGEMVRAIDAWQDVPEALDSVHAELEQLSHADIPRPHGALDMKPAFLGSLRRVLVGEEIDVDDLKAKARDIAAARNVASRWRELNDRAVRLRQRFRELQSEQQPSMGVPFQPLTTSPLDQAWMSFSFAVNQLWRRQDFREIDPEAIATQLDTAAATIDEVSLPREAERELFPETPVAGLYGQQQLGAALGAEPFAPRLEPFKALWTRPWFGQAGDALVILVLAFAAIWAGLVTLYFGKTFGGIVDYVTLALWGLGFQAAIDALASVVDRAAAARVADTTMGASRIALPWAR